jgi:hypothetical protein
MVQATAISAKSRTPPFPGALRGRAKDEITIKADEMSVPK